MYASEGDIFVVFGAFSAEFRGFRCGVIDGVISEHHFSVRQVLAGLCEALWCLKGTWCDG